MEKRLILRGFGVGALGGLLAFLFARIMAEPMVQKAIDYESGRDAAQDALRKAAGLTVAPAGADIFSRGVQRNVGIGVGMILFGLAMGGLFAVAYILVQRRTQTRCGRACWRCWSPAAGSSACSWSPSSSTRPTRPPSGTTTRSAIAACST